MNEEARNNVFRMLLKYLNQGKKTFGFSEIDSASDDGVSMNDLDEVVRKMTEDKILRKSGIEQYDIAVDIGALRDYILKQTEIEREVGGQSRKTPIEKIMNSSWTAVKPNAQTAHDYIERIRNANGYNENSDSGSFYANGKVYKNRTEYLEERRRELIRRMEEDIDDEDEEDEATKDEDDDDNDELDEFDKAIFAHLDERAEKRRQEIMQSMGDDDEDEDGDSISNEYEDNEEIYRQALKFCIERGIASVSLIQRHFPIGYIMSCKIIDWMEDNDFISPQIGSKPRRVLIDRNDYENIFGVPFDKREAKIKESEGDSALGSFLKRRASEQDRKNAAQNLVNALSRVAEKKSAPVTCEDAPGWSLWSDKEFEEVIIERLERIIKSDRRMGRQGAIKKAETYLEAVRDTHDRKMVQVYERIVYELKSITDVFYRQLKKEML